MRWGGGARLILTMFGMMEGGKFGLPPPHHAALCVTVGERSPTPSLRKRFAYEVRSRRVRHCSPPGGGSVGGGVGELDLILVFLHVGFISLRCFKGPCS